MRGAPPGQLRVWAPDARTVEAVLGEHLLSLSPEERGWWSSGDHRFPAGTDYLFSVDGRPPRPDPRSAHQPQGVDGPSRVVDHRAFKWTDGGWTGRALDSAVVYELHVGTFTPEGTFDAVVGRLGHLVDLGVGVVELMPVAEFPGRRGWGYDGVDLFAPYSAYGGPDGLKRLVDASHAHGLAVALDVVCNHLGPSGNYLAEFGPYFTDRHTTPWGTAVNYDGPGSDEVRSFVLDNAEMWLADYHFDGLRVDAVHAIHDESAVHILAELGERVRSLEAKLGRRVFVVAESDLNDPRVVEPRQAGGHALGAQWSDDFHHCIHALLTGEKAGYYADFGSLADLAKAVQRGFVYDGRYSGYRRRRHGRPLPIGLPASRLLGYLQNHDQVGNRARGERIGHLVGARRAQVGAALVMTAPFVPMLFAGEEWAASAPFRYFTDHTDADLGAAVTEGRRAEFESFGWEPDVVPDPQDPATFAASRLDWAEIADAGHAPMLDWYRLLVRLRSEVPDLGPGLLDSTTVDYDEAQGWVVWRRGAAVVAANLGREAVEVALEPPCTEVLAASDGAALSARGATLEPDSVLVAR